MTKKTVEEVLDYVNNHREEEICKYTILDDKGLIAQQFLIEDGVVSELSAEEIKKLNDEMIAKKKIKDSEPKFNRTPLTNKQKEIEMAEALLAQLKSKLNGGEDNE